MASPEPPQPSRSAKEAAGFAALGATVIAIVLGFLILGGDLQLRIQVAAVLMIALLIVAFAYTRGFERPSVETPTSCADWRPWFSRPARLSEPWARCTRSRTPRTCS